MTDAHGGIHELSSQGGDTDGNGIAPLDPTIFALLLDRIERLSRELGRAEGRRMALEEQLARLEEQVSRLERR